MNKLKAIIGTIVVLALVVIGYSYAFNKHDSSTNKDKYATAYEAHALRDPFVLVSKDWDGKEWLYTYQTSQTIPGALNAVEAQLSGGGYQVQSANPDTATNVNRDLITGDISVRAKIFKTSAGATGVIVIVKGIEK